MLQALTVAGGAATAYEAVKEAKYRESAKDIHFVPMVVDTIGAWGKSSQPVLTKMSKAWKQRFAEGGSVVYARLTAPVMHRTANMLMQAIVPQRETPVLKGVDEDA